MIQSSYTRVRYARSSGSKQGKDVLEKIKENQEKVV